MPIASEWFRPAPRIETAWFGPDGAMAAIIEAAPDIEDIPAVIGPPGRKGDTGEPGPPAIVPDPGDLTLYFQNGLT